MKRTLALTLTLALAATARPQVANTSRMDSIQHVEEVVVLSKPTFREVIPSQKLNGEQLEKLNSQSVADALRYFAGLQLKDYGGVGGIKTVNIRSMGTHHLGISYDGVELGNAQNGQIDLGQFSLDNVEEISVYNGQKSAIFQPASDFGNAGSVYIRTRTPQFDDGKSQNMRARLKVGSSDMLRVSTLYERRLSDALSASLSAGVLTASGKYRFRYQRRYPDGTMAWDTTATRHNGDIHAERVEANLHGRMNRGSWYMKGYAYNSSRGIPGAIVNNVWRRGERQQDLNTFAQGQLQKSLSERLTTQWTAKYAYYRTHYVNRDTTQLPVDNRYYQQELYVSTSNVYEIVPNWSASVSYDLRWNKLNASTYNFAYPTRLSNLVAAATAIDLHRVRAQASLLGTFVNDRTRTHGRAEGISRLSPAVFASVYPFGGRFFCLRAYAKKSFRMPTFNDLYYTDMGNAELRPESAMQYDLGLVLDHHWRQAWVSHVAVHADIYYNSVHDKIIAYPKGQQFRWTMLNLGRVHIKGADIEAEATAQPIKGLAVTGRVQYTYQDARDLTDPSTPYYRDQIAYIPWHSGSAILGLSYHRWDLNYSFIYAGERYDEQENIVYNHMEPWYTSDLSVAYTLPLRHNKWRVQLDVNNLLGQDYEVIVNYPMPGRNFCLTLSIER